MHKPLGYNPMRWNCKESGCYNQKLRPRIEEFAGCFPSKISFSDVDGVVEIKGHFLFLEWKAAGGTVSVGQRILFEQLTGLSRKVTVIIVSGEPRQMLVQSVQVVFGGKMSAPEPSNLEELRARIFAWAKRAQNAHVRPSKRDAA